MEVEGIESHPEKEDTQIITFKDRRTAEQVGSSCSSAARHFTNLVPPLQFVFTGSEIPNVGIVTLSWYSAPGVSAPAPYVKMENDGLDAKMESSEETHHHHHQTSAAGGDHRMDDDSYDLAEDDEERWE